MATKKLKEPRKVAERNIVLLGEVTRYLLEHPALFNSLPDNFELVILPEDDPEMCFYNLELLEKLGSEGNPVVFARLKSSRKMRRQKAPPSIYVPLAA